jgi:hypothetical protein
MLLNIDRNAKTIKGQAYGYMTGVLYLAPYTTSGHLVCPSASPGCIEACLFTAGRGAMSMTQQARIAKTQFLFSNRQLFLASLLKDYSTLIRNAENKGLIPIVRLNGTSDLPWEKFKVSGKSLMKSYPDLQHYDYTKIFPRMIKFLEGKLPSNYYLLFSLSEENEKQARQVLALGGSVAVVFQNGLPDTFWGYEVVDGDEHDIRYLQGQVGKVIGLKAKGRARKDTSGFVRVA